MANKRITDLDLADDVQDESQFVLDSGIQTLRCTGEQIKEYAQGDMPNQIDALATALGLVANRVTALENNVWTKSNIKDLIKTGRFSYNSDNAYSVSFSEPFVQGTDADIQVVLQRFGANLMSAQGVQNITKSGFVTDRENGIDGNQEYSYIAINMSYLVGG